MSQDHLLEHESKERSVSPAVRQKVIDRDNGQCQLCGMSGENRLHLHHLLYRSHGGQHLLENLVTLCWRCHADVHEGRAGIALIETSPGVLMAFPAQPHNRKAQT